MIQVMAITAFMGSGVVLLPGTRLVVPEADAALLIAAGAVVAVPDGVETAAFDAPLCDTVRRTRPMTFN